MVREELQRMKLKERAGWRAWEYERRLEKGKRGMLARKCLEEIIRRGREGKVNSKWEEERKLYFEERGMSMEEMERRREEGAD